MRQTKRRRTSVAAIAVVGALALASCGSDSGDESSSTEAPAEEATTTAAAAGGGTETTAAAGGDTETTAAAGGGGSAAGLEQLAADCTEEGQVNLIALPDEWANYKGILASFREKYPDVDNPVATPDASSREEMEAVQTLAGQDDMPDSVDVSPAIAQEMVDEGLFEPYTPTVAGEIPDGLKDAGGNWTAAYYGIMSILTNTTIVPNAPATFADLAKPEYEGLVALNGDPRDSGAAFAAVMAASFANGGNADDSMPGIESFAYCPAWAALFSAELPNSDDAARRNPVAMPTLLA